MKCPICDGGGRITSLPSGMPVKCTRCNGTGKVEMTNFDNIAKNEDILAKWLSDKIGFCGVISCGECMAYVSEDKCKDVTNAELWSAWLKQPRKE